MDIARYRDTLAAYLPPDTPWSGVALTLRRIPTAFGPAARVRAGLPLTRVPEARSWRTVGEALPGRVVLDPRYFEGGRTAAGLALLAHELRHVDQWRSIPDFASLYAQAAANTPADAPMDNPYERVAYQTERQVYCAEVAKGTPPGSWVPLSVQVWGCGTEAA